MLFFIKVRVDHTGISEEELWSLWEKEAEAARGAKEAGRIVSLYKVVGQRRVVMVVDAESHDELDRLAMGTMPMRHILEVEEILPVRSYDDFAGDVKRRWKS